MKRTKKTGELDTRVKGVPSIVEGKNHLGPSTNVHFGTIKTVHFLSFVDVFVILASLAAGLTIFFDKGIGVQSTPRVYPTTVAYMRTATFTIPCPGNTSVLLAPGAKGQCGERRHWLYDGAQDPMPLPYAYGANHIGAKHMTTMPSETCTQDYPCYAFEMPAIHRGRNVPLNDLIFAGFMASTLVRFTACLVVVTKRYATIRLFGTFRWLDMLVSWPFFWITINILFGMLTIETIIFQAVLIALTGLFWLCIEMFSPTVLFSNLVQYASDAGFGYQVPSFVDGADVSRGDLRKKTRTYFIIGIFVGWIPFFIIFAMFIVRYHFAVHTSSVGDIGNVQLPDRLIAMFWLSIPAWFGGVVTSHLTSPIILAKKNEANRAFFAAAIGDTIYTLADLFAKCSISWIVFALYTQNPGGSFLLRL